MTTTAVDRPRSMFPIGVLNTLTGKVVMSVAPQICFLKLPASVVRAVTFLAMAKIGAVMKGGTSGLPVWYQWRLLW